MSHILVAYRVGVLATIPHNNIWLLLLTPCPTPSYLLRKADIPVCTEVDTSIFDEGDIVLGNFGVWLPSYVGEINFVRIDLFRY